MREMLFHGKRIDNSEWIEGSLINDDGRCFIAIHPSLAFGPTSKDEINGETLWGFYPFFEVDPSTVGQYTGWTDYKNGKKIFEGDVLKAIHYFHGSRDEFKKKKIRKAYGKAIENKDSYLEEFTYFRNYVVEYSAKKCAWIGRNGSDQHELKSLTNCFHKGAVLGNIHDNPELLEVK